MSSAGRLADLVDRRAAGGEIRHHLRRDFRRDRPRRLARRRRDCRRTPRPGRDRASACRGPATREPGRQILQPAEAAGGLVSVCCRAARPRRHAEWRWGKSRQNAMMSSRLRTACDSFESGPQAEYDLRPPHARLARLSQNRGAFLTRLPMPHPEGAMPRNFVRAHRMLPVVGADRCWPSGFSVSPCERWAARSRGRRAGARRSAILTGALHEDGLADVADGFGGGRDKEAKLEIMRDSRLGTYGALILLVSFATKLSALASIPDASRLWLIAAHALGRGILPVMSMNCLCAKRRARAQRRPARCRRGNDRASSSHSSSRYWHCRGQRAVGRAGLRASAPSHGMARQAADRRPDRRRARRRRAVAETAILLLLARKI